MKAEQASAHEVSAGGVVTQGSKVLLVRMRNLQGDLVWTLPKGHLEAGESPRQAALREVEEESGYQCRILAFLGAVHYSFYRGSRKVYKRVRWYWMKPMKRVGSPDSSEILDMRWASLDKARTLLRYPGDFRLLRQVQQRGPYRQSGEVNLDT